MNKKSSIGYLMASLLLGVFFSLNIFADDSKVNVTRVAGSAAVWSDADGRWEAVTSDRKLSSGQQIRTAARSSVELVTAQNHKVKIDENSRVVVDREGRQITLELAIDTSISTVMEYFEIFLDRMKISRRAAQYLNCDFKLLMNGTVLS